MEDVVKTLLTEQNQKLDRILSRLEEVAEPFSVRSDEIELLDVYEASKLLNVSHHTLYKWVKYSGLPYVKMGNALRFDKRELIEYSKTHEWKVREPKEQKKND